MTVIESAVQWAINIANDQTHGYSQINRLGPDYDCSSLVLSAFRQAGLKITASYTGDMYLLLQQGFTDVTKKVNFNTGNGLQRGDILYWHKGGTNGHTCMYIGNGRIVHARGQSYGSPATGDQGTEITTQAYYRGSWTYCYRYTGGGTATATPTAREMCTVKVKLPVLKYNDKSSAVSVWQTILGIEADGEYGPVTKAATMAFQTNHSLKVDSEVGKNTWTAALQELT